MSKRGKVSAILAAILTLSLIVSGCSAGDTSDKTGSNSQGGTQTQAKAPDEIRIFYGTAGIPADVNLEDNPFLNKIAEMANVKFKEVTVPAYTDFKTKFNLMVSSGDVPDFVHCWFPDEVQQQGNGGAFLDWSDIIKKSPVLSKLYNDQMIEMMKDDKGKIYALRALGGLDPNSNAVRKDLIDEINNGVIPTTPDGWYDVFKKLKQKYPDSTPYSSAGGLYPLDIFFRAYGVSIGSSGAAWQYTNGKVISAFEAPLCKDAVLFHKKLYAEGLLDKTFVTNTLQDYIDRKYNKKVMIAPNSVRSVMSYIGHYAKNSKEDAVIVPGPQPIVNDSRIDISNVYTPLTLLGTHCVAIGAQTKKADAVVRLVETLLSEDVKNMTAWGREGIEYKVENGQKKLDISKSKETSYRRVYGLMFNYSSEDINKNDMEEQLELIDPSRRAQYASQFNEGINVAYSQARKVPSVSPMNFIQLSPDTASRAAEALELSKSIIVKAIIGEISMEEYDAQVASYLKKYQSITDEYNKKAEETKGKIKK